jgi:hypothetical protein
MRQIPFLKIISIALLCLIFIGISSKVLASELVLQPGTKLTVDAAQLNNPETFYFEVESDLGDFLNIDVVNESGFECEVTGQYIVSREEHVSRPTLIRYQFQVTWSPGADLSGCRLAISHIDYPKKKATLNIRMAY